MILITHKKKKSTRKWNRTHYFVNEKKPDNTKGKFREHPALIFEKSGNQVKPIVFTSSPTTNGVPNIKLKHNVDPNNTEACYGVSYRGVRRTNEFQPPKKNYRIHKDDSETVKQLKSEHKKR